MINPRKNFLILFLVSTSIISCDDALNPITPSIDSVNFVSTTEVNIEFSTTGSEQLFHIYALNQYNETFVFSDLEESPANLSEVLPGDIYKFRIASEIKSEDESVLSEFSAYTSINLASGNDDTNLNRIDFLSRINELRQSEQTCGTELMPAVPPLIWNDLLEEASKVHSIDMNTNSFLNHISESNDSTPSDRLQTVGYDYTINGENIASGQPTTASAITAWMDSEGHCKNIMNATFKETAVYKEGSYWTHVFGRR